MESSSKKFFSSFLSLRPQVGLRSIPIAFTLRFKILLSLPPAGLSAFHTHHSYFPVEVTSFPSLRQQVRLHSILIFLTFRFPMSPLSPLRQHGWTPTIPILLPLQFNVLSLPPPRSSTTIRASHRLLPSLLQTLTVLLNSPSQQVSRIYGCP